MACSSRTTAPTVPATASPPWPACPTASWSATCAPACASRSPTDNGKTWSEPERLPFAGHAADLLLASGNILLSAHRLPGTSLHYSLDFGTTWSGNVAIDRVGRRLSQHGGTAGRHGLLRLLRGGGRLEHPRHPLPRHPRGNRVPALAVAPSTPLSTGESTWRSSTASSPPPSTVASAWPTTGSGAAPWSAARTDSTTCSRPAGPSTCPSSTATRSPRRSSMPSRTRPKARTGSRASSCPIAARATGTGA